MTPRVHGHKSDPAAIGVEPSTTGGGAAVVRVDDPALPHRFALDPDRARAKAERVRKHSDDQRAAERFARRLERAARKAEATGGGR